MDEKTESLIERGVSLFIGLALLLVGLLANVTASATTTLLAIGIPLIAFATGIQLLNSLPHAIVNARNYVKNSGRKEVIIKEVKDNTTELPEWLEGRIEKVDKQLKDIIEKEQLDFEPSPKPVVLPEEPCDECEEEPVVEENAQPTQDF